MFKGLARKLGGLARRVIGPRHTFEEVAERVVSTLTESPTLDEDIENALSRPDKAFKPGSEQVYSTIDALAQGSDALRDAGLQARAHFLKFVCESALGTNTKYEEIEAVLGEIDALREKYGDSVPVTRQEAASLYIRNSGMEFDFEISTHTLSPNSEELYSLAERADSLDLAYFRGVLLPKRLEYLSFLCENALSPPALKPEQAMEVLTEAQRLQEKYGAVKGYSIADLAVKYMRRGLFAVVDAMVTDADFEEAIGAALAIKERFPGDERLGLEVDGYTSDARRRRETGYIE